MFDNIPTYPLDRPALRPLELIPARSKDQTLIVVRDPVGLIEGAAVLPADPLLLLFLEMADGKTTAEEMSSKAGQMSGQIIPADVFKDMARQLDEALLLQTDRFAEALRAKYRAWMDSPTRPYKTFAADGKDRLAMLKELGDEFRRHRMSALSPPERLDLPAGSVQAVLSPHIDYGRGGEAYAWAYQALKDHGTGARRFIVIGTCHRPTQNLFVATGKDYETPIGTVPADKELLKELQELSGLDLLAEEYAHADEHAVELQATYLRHVFQDEDISIVPILAGSVEELLHHDEVKPNQVEDVQKFTDALRKMVEKYGDDVAIVGGVDFSHCGPQFGDPEPVDEVRKKIVERNDREHLDAIETGDPLQFFESFRERVNDQRVCSIGPMYCVMEALRGRAKGRVLHYQQAVTPDNNTLVSFASVAFVKDGAEEKPKSKIILVNS